MERRCWPGSSRPAPELFAAERFPVFNFQVDAGHYYGFPISVVPGFKFGRYHHLDEAVDPETIDREPNARDEALLRQFAERYPGWCRPTMALRACMFTNAPDEHFILDLHRGCAWWSLRPAPAMASSSASSARSRPTWRRPGETRHDIGLFQISRFADGGQLQRIRQ